MNSRFLLQLAIQSIHKHRQTTVPYIFTVSSYSAMCYLLLWLNQNSVHASMPGEDVFAYLLNGAAIILAVFVCIFLVYSTNFWLQPRAKEFGLLNLFGLSRRHLVAVITYEIFIIYGIAVICGVFIGIALSQLMNMILSAIIKVPLVVDQYISPQSLLTTLAVFVVVMLVIMIKNTFFILKTQPISLFRHVEPQSVSRIRQLIPFVLWVVCFGYAYVRIALVDSPQSAFGVVAAVMLAIVIGTYCFFMTLGYFIRMLVTFRPEVYYQANYFIVLNGLLNRVRVNAISLASISIFGFIILILISMSAVIYFGADESVTKMYAADTVITANVQDDLAQSQLYARVDEVLAREQVSGEYVMPLTYVSMSMIQSGDSFQVEPQDRVYVGNDLSHYFVLITQDQYNALYKESLMLQDGEVAVYSSYLPLPETFYLDNVAYRVVKRLPYLSIAQYELTQLVNIHYLVVNDYSVLQMHQQPGSFLRSIRYRFGLNLVATAQQKIAVYEALQKNLPINQENQTFIIQSRQAEKVVFESVYGTLFFLGLFLGSVFIMSTALLIYYKQIAEGYEDKVRYEILQRIGMSHREVQINVDKQIVVFFSLPLIIAGINFVAVLPLFMQLLALFRIQDITLLVSAVTMALLIFTLIYFVIYRYSARMYYNIVR